MVHSSLRVVLAAAKREEACRIVRSLLGPTRAQPGCICCHFFQDVEDKNTLCYVEQWQTEEDLARHIQGDDYRKVFALMELSSQPPEMRFHTVSENFGMDYLTRVRTTVE